jgi:hypothetical protein
MEAGKFEATDDAPFEIVNFQGTSKVQYVKCLLCKATVWDDAKDGKEKSELLTTAAIAHLEFSHPELFGPR